MVFEKPGRSMIPMVSTTDFRRATMPAFSAGMRGATSSRQVHIQTELNDVFAIRELRSLRLDHSSRKAGPCVLRESFAKYAHLLGLAREDEALSTKWLEERFSSEVLRSEEGNRFLRSTLTKLIEGLRTSSESYERREHAEAILYLALGLPDLHPVYIGNSDSDGSGVFDSDSEDSDEETSTDGDYDSDSDMSTSSDASSMDEGADSPRGNRRRKRRRSTFRECPRRSHDLEREHEIFVTMLIVCRALGDLHALQVLCPAVVLAVDAFLESANLMWDLEAIHEVYPLLNLVICVLTCNTRAVHSSQDVCIDPYLSPSVAMREDLHQCARVGFLLLRRSCSVPMNVLPMKKLVIFAWKAAWELLACPQPQQCSSKSDMFLLVSERSGDLALDFMGSTASVNSSLRQDTPMPGDSLDPEVDLPSKGRIRVEWSPSRENSSNNRSGSPPPGSEGMDPHELSEAAQQGNDGDRFPVHSTTGMKLTIRPRPAGGNVTATVDDLSTHETVPLLPLRRPFPAKACAEDRELLEKSIRRKWMSSNAPRPVLEGIDIVQQHIQSPPGVNADADEDATLKGCRDCLDFLYVEILRDSPHSILSLLKILLAAIPSTKMYTGSVNLDAELVYAHPSVPSDLVRRPQEAAFSESVDYRRQREIVLKAVSGLLALLLKKFHAGHRLYGQSILQFEYVSRLLVDANSILLFLKMLNIPLKAFLKKVSEDQLGSLFLTADRVRRQRSKGVVGSEGMIRGVQRYISSRNVQVIFNVLKSLQRLTKYRSARIKMMTKYKSQLIFERVLKLNHPSINLYVLKLLKSQMPFMKKRWRGTHMWILSLIYGYLDTRLCDTWLTVDPSIESSSSVLDITRSFLESVPDAEGRNGSGPLMSAARRSTVPPEEITEEHIVSEEIDLRRELDAYNQRFAEEHQELEAAVVTTTSKAECSMSSEGSDMDLVSDDSDAASGTSGASSSSGSGGESASSSSSYDLSDALQAYVDSMELPDLDFGKVDVLSSDFSSGSLL